MRVLLTDLHTTLGGAIARHLQDADHEVLGIVASKSQLASTKRVLLDHPSSDRADAIKDPVAVHSDKVALTKLLHKADVVVVTSLLKDTKSGMEMLKLFEKEIASSSSSEEEDTGRSAVKRFVALSSVLSWSKNAAFAGQKEQRSHREDDYKTRKPARKYADLKTAETQILSANRPDTLETCVVACGLVYGGAQSNLTPLFRNAWMYPDQDLLVPALPGSTAPKPGENLLPMISVYDLALLTARLAVAPAVPKPYVVATDKPSQSTTLRDVCVGLSVLLGNGRVQDTLSDDEIDALLVSDDDIDGDAGALAALQLHLCFDSLSETSAMTSLVPLEEYQHATTGLLSNLAFYVDDFIRSMDLRPLKTVILGPPRVGKTLLSQRMAKDYYLPHITVESIVDEVTNVTTRVTSDHNEAASTAEAKPEEDTVDTLNPQLRQLCGELEVWRASGESPRVDDLPEATIVELLRWKLTSAGCRNQGYVLDGLPVSAVQAGKIFELIETASPEGETPADGNDADAKDEPVDDIVDANAEAEDGADAKSSSTLRKSRSKMILDRLRPKKQIEFPNRVIVLHAPLELLQQRAQSLAEDVAIATGNTQSLFQARLDQFNTEAEAIATFFESSGQGAVEVLELHLDSESSYLDSNESLYLPVKKYMDQGGNGKPTNFHPTRQEIKMMESEYIRKQLEDQAKQKQQEEEEKERESATLHAKMEAEHARLELIQREEAELLEARAKPLRTYLMDTVLPALTEGMLEIVKVQPEDPIDYLAEFLFKKGREMEASN